MCDDVCLPGEQDVSITLPLSADSPQPDEAVRAAIAKMPIAGAAHAEDRAGNYRK